MNTKRLFRKHDERILLGVCSGLASYFDVDITIVRLIFVILAFWGGFGILLYIIGAFIIPDEPVITTKSSKSANRENFVEFVEDVHKKTQSAAEDLKTAVNKTSKNRDKNNQWLGVIIVTIGLLLFLENFIWFSLAKLWPIVLIVLGLVVLSKQRKEQL